MGRQYDRSGSTNYGFTMNGNMNAGRDINTTFYGQDAPESKGASENKGEEQKIKIVFIAANPDGSERLRSDREWQVINNVLRLSPQPDRFLLKAIWAARADDVLQELFQDTPQFLHFSGHAEADGLLLEYPMGGTQAVPLEAFIRTVKHLAPGLHCVFLNACHTALQDVLVAAKVPCIAISGTIYDTAALEFARWFYTGIGAGKSVEDAFQASQYAVQWIGPSHGFVSHLFV